MKILKLLGILTLTGQDHDAVDVSIQDIVFQLEVI